MRKKIMYVVKEFVKKAINNYKIWNVTSISKANIKSYVENGQIPWSVGYPDFRREAIKKAILDLPLQASFAQNKLIPGFGYRLDERIVEYVWIFSNLLKGKTTFLDAGSTLNFKYLVEHPAIQEKDLFIYTYYPEEENFVSKRISYNFGDLRDLPYRDDFFEEIVCQSTIEHIDMDNSMYGYDLKSSAAVKEKNYEYIKVIDELVRVLKTKGQLLLTFPYGKFENHGFFQQFDNEMVDRILDRINNLGALHTDYYLYADNAWNFSSKEQAKDAESYNPHTGIGKKDDFAAHSRAICCIKFIKN
jgi:hypothetical protein